MKFCSRNGRRLRQRRVFYKFCSRSVQKSTAEKDLDKEVKAMTEMAWKDFHNKASRYGLAPLTLLFQLQTGLRIGEVCAVSFDDIETPATYTFSAWCGGIPMK